jgi:protein required for attachment to host cells
MFVLEKDGDLQAGSRLVEKIDLVNTNYTARGKDAPGVRSERNTSRQAGPVHPQDAERDWHRMELERRFAREIAAHASAMAKAGGADKVILVAEPRMLGLLRRPLRAAAGKRVAISEIARNHTRLTPSRLHQRLVADHLIR